MSASAHAPASPLPRVFSILPTSSRRSSKARHLHTPLMLRKCQRPPPPAILAAGARAASRVESFKLEPVEAEGRERELVGPALDFGEARLAEHLDGRVARQLS